MSRTSTRMISSLLAGAWRLRKFSATCPLALMPGIALVILLSGCDQNMIDQPRAESLEPSSFFKDGKVSRPLVEGTVPRGYDATDFHFLNGLVDEKPATEFPDVVAAKSKPETEDFLKRGQQRYQIFCTPCHGESGYGNGMVVQRGFPAPPSFHLGENGERLRAAPVGYFYDVISNGVGRMSGYKSQIPPEDRWAIIAYVRALQLSQHSDIEKLIEELPESDRELVQPKSKP